MHLSIRGRLVFLLLTVPLALVLVAACGDDGDGGINGSPTTAPPANIGEGRSPIDAFGPILVFEGLGGHFLDPNAQSSCPLDEVIETPGVVTRGFLGQFCITLLDYDLEEGGTLIVENNQAGGIWSVKLTVEDEIWKVVDIKQVSG